jgi:hypothetical protein
MAKNIFYINVLLKCFFPKLYGIVDPSYHLPKKTWTFGRGFTCRWTREGVLQSKWRSKALGSTHPRFVCWKTALRSEVGRNLDNVVWFDGV